MSKQTGIGSFFRPVTLSNEKDSPNVTINKNVAPYKVLVILIYLALVLHQQNHLHTQLHHHR